MPDSDLNFPKETFPKFPKVSDSEINYNELGQFPNNDKLISFEFSDSTMAIIVSDVHIGGGDTDLNGFRKFLELIINTRKENQEFRKNFRAFIILGDFIDLLMNSIDIISETNLDIYEKLNYLNRDGILIINTLGNHEIPVNGDYNRRFPIRKQRLIEELKVKNFPLKFFNYKNLTQYLVLEGVNGNKWQLSLYDSRHHFPHYPLSKYILGDIDPNASFYPIITTNRDNKPPKMIMLHGYQFFPTETQLYGTMIWRPLLTAKPQTKALINQAYNEVAVKLIRTKGKEYSEKILKEAFKVWKDKVLGKQTLMQKIKNMDQIMLRNLFLKMAELQQNIQKMTNDLTKITNFIDKSSFEILTHIIFGHTHQSLQVMEKEIMITNTGAWQHVSPTFVSIRTDGSIKLHNLYDK